MLMQWLTERRRSKLLEQPFPPAWQAVLARNVPYFAWLADDEREHLRQLVQVFVAEKRWEGLGGLELDDEIRVTIAASACMLVLGLEHELYRNVDEILVYPHTVVPPAQPRSFFSSSIAVVEQPLPILGQAFTRGPVILVWDAVRSGARRPDDGHNVVYHEFAHKLDMLSGSADGVPPMQDTATYDRWVAVMTREYEALRAETNRGREGLLEPYALKNGAEFFAVATEHFFEQPVAMASAHAAMYEVLGAFYRQDTAARERRWRAHAGR